MRPLGTSCLSRLVAFVVVLCATAALAPRAHAAVRGTVIDPDGKAIAGARVSLFAFESAADRRIRLLSESPEPVPVASTQTDAKGNFSFESPKLPATVRVFLRGFAPVETAVEPDDDTGAIILPRAPVKSGSVSAAGKPVAGAVVAIRYASEYVTRTDAEGRYEAPDPRFASSITVIQRGYAIDEETPRSNDGIAPSRLQRTLTRGTTRTGIVVGADGRTPVAGAVLTLDDWPVATSGADGTFTIANAPANWTKLKALKDTSIGLRPFAAAGTLTVRMAPAAAISGRAFDRKTRVPLAGAVVSLRERAFGRSVSSASTTATDAKGNFAFLAPAGSWTMSASHPAYEGDFAEVPAVAGRKISKDLSLQALARVAGHVVDEERRPLPGAAVELSEMRRGGPMRFVRSGMRAATAPDGRFVVRVTAEQDLRLRATKKGLPPAESETLKLAPAERKSGVVITVPAGIEVTGLVTDQNGDPLPGVKVSIVETQSDARGMRFMRFVGTAATSDEELVQTVKDGTFSLRAKEGTYDFLFRRDGFAPRALRSHAVTRSGGEPVEVALEPSVEISGRVVREGAPVEGVNIFGFDSMLDAAATTDAAGAFTLSGLAPGQLRVSLRKDEEFVQDDRSLTAPARDVVIELPPGGRVSGRVVEKESGRPVTAFQAGVSVSRSGGGMVMMAPPMLQSFASDDGSFVLENVPAGAVNLVASAPGYTSARTTLTVDPKKPLEGIEIGLDTGVRLAGRVTGPTGAPVADASVWLTTGPGSARMPGAPQRTTTDANGEYAMETLEPGEQTVEFSHAKFLPARRSVSLKGKDVRVDVQLEGGQRVRGLVVDAAGSPVADAEVVAGSSAAGSSWETARSGPDGSFEFESLASGRYTFRASRQGYVDGRVDDFDPASGAALRLVLGSGGTIYGRVIGLSEADLQFATVDARGPRSSSSTGVDGAGNFRIEGVEAGTVRVSATVESRTLGNRRSSAVETVEMTAGGSQQVDVEFPAGTTISGRVLRNGLPVAAAAVQFSPRTAAAQTSAGATADESGSYSVSGLQDGLYNVNVVDMRKFSPYQTTYEVRGSATFDIEYTTASVSGRVVDATTGEPVAEANVQLRPASSAAGDGLRSTRAAASDGAGNFAIEDVAAAVYTIGASREGYAGTPVELRVDDRPVHGLELQLTKTDGVLLRVVDATSGQPLRASAIVHDTQGRVVHDTRMSFGMTADGGIRLSLPAGSFRALVGASGFAPQSVHFNAPGTQTVALSRGGTLVIESKQPTRRRARLVDASGRVYELFPRLGGFIDLNPRPGSTTVENIAPGSYTLTLLSEDESSVESSVGVVLREATATRVEL